MIKYSKIKIRKKDFEIFIANLSIRKKKELFSWEDMII